MTKDKVPPESKRGGPAKRLVLAAIAGTVLLAGGVGAGAYFGGAWFGAEAKPSDNLPKLVLRQAVELPESEDEKAGPRVGTVAVPNDRFRPDPRKFSVAYHPIADSFTTNLADGSGFLQIGISLSTYYDDRVIANIKRQAVPIRSAVLMVLAEQDPALLSTSQGKQRLQRQLAAAINDVLRSKEGFGGVDDVYFTNMVIQ